MSHDPNGGRSNGKRDSRFITEQSCGLQVRSNGSGVRLPALYHLLAVTLDRSYHFSESQFPYLYMGMIIVPKPERCYEDYMN